MTDVQLGLQLSAATFRLYDVDISSYTYLLSIMLMMIIFWLTLLEYENGVVLLMTVFIYSHWTNYYIILRLTISVIVNLNKL